MIKHLPQTTQLIATAGDYAAGNVSIDTLPDGGWIVSWEDPTYLGAGIHVQRYDETGGKIGTELNLGMMNDHDVAVLHDGSWLFARALSSGPATVWHFDIEGQRAEWPIEDGEGFRSMTGLATGGWLAIWSAVTDAGDLELLQQKYGADGAAVGLREVIETSAAGALMQSGVVALDDGGWVVAWQSSLYNEHNVGMQQQRYDSNGNAVGDIEQITNVLTSYSLQPELAALADGGWITSWKVNDDDDARIVMQRYDESGNADADQIILDKARDVGQGEWDIQGLSGGGWVLLWQNTDYRTYENTLRLQVFDAAGNAAGRQTIVEDGFISTPVLTALDDDVFVVSWMEDYYDGAAEIKQRVFGTVENTLPVAIDNVVEMAEREQLSLDVVQNDSDADDMDLLTLESATVLSGNASVSIAENGELLIQDENTQLIAGQKAIVTIEYTVSDGFETDTGLVTIDVTGMTDEGDQVRGTEKADRYQGFDFDDFYFGIGGNDVINGRDGDDFLVGGNGKDRINGGDGHDTIVGGVGDDRLYGSWGTDTFGFGPGDGRDVILIRESGSRSHDILDLSDFGFRNFNQVRRMTEVSYFDLIIDLPGRDRIKIDGGAYFGIDVII